MSDECRGDVPIAHNHIKLGKSGEDFVAQKLTEMGYEVLHQNFNSPYGEIDIIARDNDAIAFIEVKTRTKESIDHAHTSITYSKQKKLTKTAMYFLHTYQNPEINEYRFDVVILKKEQFHHLINAFPPAEVGDFFA